MPHATLSDEALAQQYKANQDPNLINELLRRHQAQVVRACKQFVKDYDTAQDIAQEVFLRVLDKIHTFEGKSSFATWLHTIVERRCLDHLKGDKKKMHREISERIIDTLAEEWEDELEKLTVEKLEIWMKKLSGKEKRLVTMKYQENWSIKAIAESFGTSEGTIKTSLQRIKEKLKKMMEEG